MPEQIFHTAGGPVIEKLNEYTQGNKIIILNFGQLSPDQVLAVINGLAQRMARAESRVLADQEIDRLVVASPGEKDLVLSEEVAKALGPAAAALGQERAYLAALAVNPDLSLWLEQYVPLEGTLTAQERPPGWLGDWKPEYARLVQEGSGGQPVTRLEKLPDITQALVKDPAFALVGEPGAGKTTTLSRLALQEARKRLAGEPARLPLLLPLNDFRAGEALDFVRRQAERALGAAACLEERLRRQELLLLCDSLNEMPFEDAGDYARKVGQLQQLTKDWPGNQFVFTCRTLDYTERLDLPQVLIIEMDDPRVQEFLHLRLGPEKGLQAWKRLHGSDLLDLFRNPWYLNMMALLVILNNRWPENRAGLFKGFTEVLWERERKKILAKSLAWPGQAALERALDVLAATLQPAGRGTRLPEREALAVLPGQVDVDGETVALDPQAVLELGLGASLLRKDPEKQVSFFHHQLQEYFAARELLRRFAAGEDLAAYWRPPEPLPAWEPVNPIDFMPPPPGTGWEEPTRIAIGLAALDGSTVTLAALLPSLQAANPALAADCLREPGLPEEELAAPKKQVQAALLQRMTDGKAHLRARLAAGEALGRLGDPRFEEIQVDGVRVLLPPLIQLPGGTFQMGTGDWEALWLKNQGLAVSDEKPQHPQTVPPFAISRFPVTNAEFRCFWEADGYREERYWKSAQAQAWRRGEQDLTLAVQSQVMQIWRWLKQDWERGQQILKQAGRSDAEIATWAEWAKMDEAQVLQEMAEAYRRPNDQPAYWGQIRFDNPSQPVTGVTWFEAAAYCCWLDEKLRQSGRLTDPNLQARLASEVEWEYAARGGENRAYPWGPDFDPLKANTLESHVGRPSPVGMYPDGAAAQGVLDLAGNAWEWTLSR